MKFPVVSVINDSFQEYPGKWSLVLFSWGCNLSCSECHNRSVVCNKNIETIEGIDVLNKKITPVHESVVFLGGEPTIWKDGLLECLKHVKNVGLSSKLFTNGTLPNVIEEAAPFLNSVSIDLKSVKNIKDVMDQNHPHLYLTDDDYLTRIKKSVEILTKFGVCDIEFRTTLWDSVLDQIEDIKLYAQSNFPNINHIIQEKINFSNPYQH